MRPTGNVFSMPALAIALAAALGGCESSAYVMSQLGEIPTPQPALLKKLPKPNCNTGGRVDSRTTENEFTGTTQRTSMAVESAEKASEPSFKTDIATKPDMIEREAGQERAPAHSRTAEAMSGKAMNAKSDSDGTPEEKIATAGDGESKTPDAEAKKESGKAASDNDSNPSELGDGEPKKADKDAKIVEAGAGAQKKRDETSSKPAKNEKTGPDPKNPVNEKDVVQNLEDERDCYRSAENRAHKRLNKLQTSAAETIAAVNRMKKQYQYVTTLSSHKGSAVTMRSPRLP